MVLDGGRRTEDGGRRGGGRTCGRDRPFPSFPARFRSGDKEGGGIQFIMHLRHLSLQILGSVAASAIVGGTRHIDKPPKKEKVLRGKKLEDLGKKVSSFLSRKLRSKRRRRRRRRTLQSRRKRKGIGGGPLFPRFGLSSHVCPWSIRKRSIQMRD